MALQSPTALIRTIVQRILKENGFDNHFSVRGTNFSCERHRNYYYSVTIKDWTPNPLGSDIEKSIKRKSDDIEIGALVAFEGKGFVQG